MNKLFITISLLSAITAGSIFFHWHYGATGTVSVTVPKDVEVIIEGDFITLKTVGSYGVPLEYGRYRIRVPDYNVACTIHKNNRGTAVIEVVDVNEFHVKCNSNAWLVTE